MSVPWVSATAEFQNVSKSTCSSCMSVEGSSVTSASGWRTCSTTVVTSAATTSRPATPHRRAGERGTRTALDCGTAPDAIRTRSVSPNRSPATAGTGMMTPVFERRPAALALVLVLVATGAACARPIPGRPGVANPPDASSTSTGPTAGPTPEPSAAEPAGTPAAVAEASTRALQAFWRDAFPTAFGKPWREITQFVPVHSHDTTAVPPPCLRRAADVTGQAYYCPTADAVVWDTDELIPQLQEKNGPAGPLVVLAHEIGHAVQNRLGIDEAQAKAPAQYPTILLEAMADCDAGVALASFMQHPPAGVPFGPAERDGAVGAIVGFRDPLGIQSGDQSAHGNAFDRVSAFQDGYGGGATTCAAMTMANQRFTQRRFGSAADQQRKGNLPLTTLLAAVEADARSWFTTLGPPGWSAPALRPAPTGACPKGRLTAQGPASFCAADGSIAVDTAALAPLHDHLGDFADAVLVASRYGLATLAARGATVTDPAAGATATCLAGAYTGRLIDPTGGFSLSPGDLDESVQVLLADSWAARDAEGDAEPAGRAYDRIAQFRAGLLEGAAHCLPA